MPTCLLRFLATPPLRLSAGEVDEELSPAGCERPGVLRCSSF